MANSRRYAIVVQVLLIIITAFTAALTSLNYLEGKKQDFIETKYKNESLSFFLEFIKKLQRENETLQSSDLKVTGTTRLPISTTRLPICQRLVSVTPALPVGDDCNVASRISAFNIEILGVTKMSKPEVVEILVQILELYDLVLIQEIRDQSEQAIKDLLNALNSRTNNAYSMEISNRLGRTSSKEQYAFFYRNAVFQVVDSYHYDDVGDLFEREPFIVRFSFNAAISTMASNGIKEFAFVGIHAKPDDAKAEIDLLTDVYDDVVSHWGIQDVIIGGDFNADCNYVRQSDWSEIRLWTQPRFEWLLGDEIDSTVSSTDCAYDRLVVAGSMLPTSIVPSSPAVFYFDQEFSLSHDEADAVSDHYPVEMSLSVCPVSRTTTLPAASSPAPPSGGSSLRVAAFNPDILGLTKMSKPEVVDILVQIIERYDVILIQEIRDQSGDAIQDLLDAVNLRTAGQYSMVISDRLGRSSSSQEQYAFFYRPSSLQVVDSYHYDDVSRGDVFEREPFIAKFSLSGGRYTSTGINEFAFVAIRAKAGDAKEEIDYLADVYDDVYSHWGLQNVIIGGDFYADCSYVSRSDWSDIRLRTEDRFVWLIGDEADTTLSSSDCAYDRMVVAGSEIIGSVDPASPAIFRFDQEYFLSSDEADDVSDRYPVEMALTVC